jgi:hypothetical protein
MKQSARLYYQRIVAAALEKEFGFSPSKLNQIILLEAENMGFYIFFRIGEHYYTYRHGKIERTNDRGGF